MKCWDHPVAVSFSHVSPTISEKERERERERESDTIFKNMFTSLGIGMDQFPGRQKEKKNRQHS